jgi:transcriptional regulator with XRE-family HTH domain
MAESFGDKLRQRRERQHITLGAIAEQTKIKQSLLEGLERDDVSHWPVGIFRRAFVRAYAHAIGLDPDVVVREFQAVHPEPFDTIADAVPDALPDGAKRASPPTRLRVLVDSAIGSLSISARDVLEKRRAAPDSAAVAAPVTPSFDPDWVAAADLCTKLGRATGTTEIASSLEEMARILDAVGLIVWIWNAQTTELKAALTHGYSDSVRGRLPAVKRDADNATAAAFRTGTMRVVDGAAQASGAVVVPLMTSAGCAGVLAVEVQNGFQQMKSVRSLMTIFAAQLAGWIAAEQPIDLTGRKLA